MSYDTSISYDSFVKPIPWLHKMIHLITAQWIMVLTHIHVEKKDRENWKKIGLDHRISLQG